MSQGSEGARLFSNRVTTPLCFWSCEAPWSERSLCSLRSPVPLEADGAFLGPVGSPGWSREGKSVEHPSRAVGLPGERGTQAGTHHTVTVAHTKPGRYRRGQL